MPLPGLSNSSKRLHDLRAVHSNFKQLKELLCSGISLGPDEISQISQELEASLATLETEIKHISESQSEQPRNLTL